MDVIDKMILRLLAEDASITATEISEQVNLSVPAVNKRIQKMSKDGIIKKFTLLTDEAKIGKPITAFVFVVLASTAAAEELVNYAEAEQDVLECHAVTGEYDYLIKLCASDVRELENKLLHMKKQKGVLKSHTMLSLMQTKLSPAVLPNL